LVPLYKVHNEIFTGKLTKFHPTSRTITIGAETFQININDPVDGYNTTNTSINFNWTVDDVLITDFNCSLIIDNIVNVSKIAAVDEVAVNYTINEFKAGYHNWSLSCNDSSQIVNSTTRSFYIVKAVETINITFNTDNTTTLGWNNASYADSYNIYITDNYDNGFQTIPNITGITDNNWTDANVNTIPTRALTPVRFINNSEVVSLVLLLKPSRDRNMTSVHH